MEKFLTLEEYIQKKKTEDRINEFALSQLIENEKRCSNYVVEYFNEYIPNYSALPKKNFVSSEKCKKYKRSLVEKYSKSIIIWLLDFYINYGEQLDTYIENIVFGFDFIVFDTAEEFEVATNYVYQSLIKKYQDVCFDIKMVEKFIKEYYDYVNTLKHNIYYISDGIDKWLDDIFEKYGVNLYCFCLEWVNHFCASPEIWVKNNKKEASANSSYCKNDMSAYYWEYDYKHSKDLLCISSAYEYIKDKEYVKNDPNSLKRIEIIMMFIYLKVLNKDSFYWNEYLSQQEKHLI